MDLNGDGTDDHLHMPEEDSTSTGRPSRGNANRIARKRTKTGCLTCRKRRIKCGEEKPTCANCIKSKRHCEGYNPRIVFRRTASDTRDADLTQPPYTFSNFNDGPYTPYMEDAPFMDVGTMPPPLATLAPRPSDSDPSLAGYNNAFVHPYFAPQYTDHAARTGLNLNVQGMMEQQLAHQSQSPYSAITHQQTYHPEGAYFLSGTQNINPHDRNNSFNAPVSPLSQYPENWAFSDSKTAFERSVYKTDEISPITSHGSEQYSDSNTALATNQVLMGNGANRPARGGTFGEHSHQRAFSYQDPYSNGSIPTPIESHDDSSHYSSRQRHFSAPTPTDRYHWPGITQALEEAAVEVEDNDYFDVDSDEEDNVIQAKALASGSDSQRQLGVMLSLYQQATDELGFRSLDAFIYPGMLDTYRAERVANPLKNPSTARVFGHFISSTAPMLSCFERHPRQGSAMFNAGPVRAAQQSLWTYTIPMMAMHNQGLLHAILALGSLHIAKLSGASNTPSYKHYAWSIRRVHRAVSQDRKRHEVTTLAATLLLGFYEIMTADHMKWSTHLYGARQLIVEIDYAGMTRKVKEVKARHSLASLQRSSSHPHTFFDHEEESNVEDPFSDSFPDVDARLVSNLMGKTVRYNEYGRVVGDPSEDHERKEHISNAELRNFEVLQDVFWWYCKQDIVHALIGGNKLLMDYDLWAACPPRAPIGIQSAAYGTYDHLVLLLGRIAQFVANDRPRKIKVSEVKKGPLDPQSSSGKPGATASTSQSQKTDSNPGTRGAPPQGSTNQQPPPFYGMSPMADPYMPTAFRPDMSSTDVPQTSGLAFPSELEAATAAALEEWNSIRSALTIFAESLGPSYQPLSPEEHKPLDTPFGLSAAYRGYDIGGVWMNYYLALIVLTRGHPSMPPASNVAAVVAARQTAQYANEIGRIAAGITETITVNNSPNAPLNPSLAGAFSECVLPLFFAGVQYNSAAQRRWTVQRFREIERRSGWASAGVCAGGCELSWERQAEHGGPPYDRELMHPVEDPCASGRPGSVVANIMQPDERFREYTESSRLVSAFGLLGTMDDLKRLTIDASSGSSPSAPNNAATAGAKSAHRAAGVTTA